MAKKALLFSLLVLLVVVVCAEDAKEKDFLKKLEVARKSPFRGDKQKKGPCGSAAKRQDCADDDICDPLYTSQWHLNKDFLNFTDPNEVGVDMGVQGAWAMGYKGEGVLISFVDDGVEIGHPDLTGCTRSVSYDFDGGGSDPSKDSDHGTSCAGAAVARRNDVCGVGVAHEANYGGVRLLRPEMTASDEAIALTYGLAHVDIYSNSWGPPDDGMTLENLPKTVSQALEQGVNVGRGGKGSIYMWAGGNGAGDGDACSYDGFVQSPFTIPIGAVDEHGKRSYYSESCAALLACATSSGDSLGIVTTDRMPPNGWNPDAECTYDFSGTSAATPQAAGVVALMLQAKPELTWRDVQAVLIHSSVKTDREDPQWKENGAGLLFNPQYGYGLINATRAVQAALEWEGLGPYTLSKSSTKKFGETIPRGKEGFTYEFEIDEDDVAGSSPSKMEHAVLTVDITHPARNNLTITLTSPSGTVSTLASPHLQGQIPTFVLYLSGPVPISGASMGFGTVYDQESNAPLRYFVDCDVGEEESYSGKNVIVLMNQGKCTPYEQFIALQDAGASAVIFVPDYTGPFQEFEASDSDDSDVLIPVMQIGQGIGMLIIERQQDFNGLDTTVTAIEHVQKDYENFPFSSVQYWGENAVGTWTVHVIDVEEDQASGKQGTVKSLQLSVYGENFATEYEYEKTSMFTTFQLILFCLAILLAVAVAVLVGVSYYMNRPSNVPPAENPFERLSEEEDFQ